MLFSKEEVIVEYTIEKCKKCNAERKRKFTFGDTLFSETTKCNLCDGMMSIEKIFGEKLEK